MMFEIKSYRDWIVPEMSQGDMIELERLTCKANSLYDTMRRTGRAAVADKLKAIHADARAIKQRYA